MNPTEIRAYNDLIREKGLRMAPDRQVPQSDGSINLVTDWSRLCLWKDGNEAQGFADELQAITTTAWIVAEVDDSDIDENQAN